MLQSQNGQRADGRMVAAKTVEAQHDAAALYVRALEYRCAVIQKAQSVDALDDGFFDSLNTTFEGITAMGLEKIILDLQEAINTRQEPLRVVPMSFGDFMKSQPGQVKLSNGEFVNACQLPPEMLDGVNTGWALIRRRDRCHGR